MSKISRQLMQIAVLGAGIYLCLCVYRPAVAQQATGSKFDEASSKAATANASEKLDGRDGRPLALDAFRPRPSLKVKQTLLPHAKFPVIDVHTHFGVKLPQTKQALDDFVAVMDRQNIAMCVTLDGRWGEHIDDHKKFLGEHAKRFAIFAQVDWRGTGKVDDPASWACQRADFGRTAALSLADAKARGAVGLKIFKGLGLEYKNPDGSLVRVDDERWDPIWQACGELGFPIVIHTGDPVAFFQSIDEHNERWEELHRRPDWSFHESRFPKHGEVLEQLLTVVKRHPKTNFIAAHLANNGEDLETLGTWLDEHPNLYVDTASRINELGRQPYTARAFLIKYADRILFGTDGPWLELRLQSYWRHFETYDEYFPYSEKEFPPQGLWNIYGVGLPDDVLKKIYGGNAEKLLPVLRKR
jgi:predicted TIM-barrel fold metal-dependent hydrolase